MCLRELGSSKVCLSLQFREGQAGGIRKRRNREFQKSSSALLLPLELSVYTGKPDENRNVTRKHQTCC
eukprot:3489375-Amphidinium_carterae.1